jgi:polyisoprenyl-phosphate glycosyltransferase
MFSLVVPIYNEEYLVDELVLRSVTAIEGFTFDYEIIFVDDGSTDSSLQNLLLARQKNSRIKVLSLSKNFGHQAAFTAGLEHAAGDTVAMMDGDLQDPPELLPGMYNKIHKEGIDIVSGKRIGRTGRRSIRFYTFLFHLLFKNLAGIQNIENTGNFSMMNRIALTALLTMREKVRYMPGLRSFIGFKHDFVEYFREDRKMGRTKMNLSRLFILGTDAIFSFSKFPVRLCLLLGIVGTVFFMAAGLYVMIARILGIPLTGWSYTMLSIYFIGSIQLVFMGIIGEYVFRIYKESQGRPIYFVKKYYSGENSNQQL